MPRVAQLTAPLLAVALAAGCGSAHAARIGAKTTSGVLAAGGGGSCGRAYTAGHVPIILKVSTGTVACSQAQQVETAYNREIAAGKAPGNGGGGPVQVDGWTCQGLPTPRILRTGEVSTCAKDGNQFTAVLTSPSPAPSPT